MQRSLFAVAAAGVGLAAVLMSGTANAQDLRGSPPLPVFPQIYETSEQKIRVVELANGLSNPWSMAFLPNGDMLVTERAGRLRILHNGVLDPQPIAGVPEVRITTLGGLLEVLLHPDFADNQLVYLSYAKGGEGNLSTTALARGRFNGKKLSGLKDIFIAESWSTSPTNFGGRMAFGRDGKLYLTIGERQEQDRAQKPDDLGGKVLRLNDDGSVPADNPFVGTPGYRPEIYSLGHRSPQGLAVHPVTGALWENEHGPLGGDEINIVLPGRNYGWPLVTYGKTYEGEPISDATSRPDLEPPFMYWVPSIAISGLTFYTGDRFPAWKGNAFVGSMMHGRIRWTGHIQRLTFNDKGLSITREPILAQLRQRIRDVREGPDGLLYVLTDQDPG
ncbi:MAG TPA: PQQ-dependent sugar dehydrogenase, partial [Gammaproteobacteria bacterium]|nr:PQQ-dependent sugar dehydrogenase [Gammaproteobacteria bacterium]